MGGVRKRRWSRWAREKWEISFIVQFFSPEGERGARLEWRSGLDIYQSLLPNMH